MFAYTYNHQCTTTSDSDNAASITKEEVDQAVEEYLNVPKPEITDMFDYMYADLPHDLEAQRRYALELEEKSNG